MNVFTANSKSVSVLLGYIYQLPYQSYPMQTIRNEIKQGQRVEIIEKQNQRNGKTTGGIVEQILTNSSHHPRGIKVRLTSGAVGRVSKIMK